MKIERGVKEVVERAELTAIEARRQIGRDEDLLDWIEARRSDRQGRQSALIEKYRTTLWERWSSRWLSGAPRR
jgi:hypothetical protein